MNSKTNAWVWVALIAVAVIAIGAYAFPKQVQQAADLAGGVTTGTLFPHGISVGLQSTSPTNLANFKVGTCNMIASSFTIAASSSVAVDCAVTGVTTSYIVQAWFATSSANGAGWQVTQSSASTTAGFITMRIVNNTGASAVIPSSLASTTKYAAYLTQ